MTEEILKQRSTAWRKRRLGCVTASRFADVLTKPREKGAEWSKTAETYLLEKLSELINCQPSDNFTSAPTRWGTEWEDEAFQRAIPVIEERFGEKLDKPEGEFAFIEHPGESHIGCSPDGIVGDDILLELKCNYNPAVHLRIRRAATIPEYRHELDEMLKQYQAQMQGSLWVTGRTKYIFGTYDHRVTASDMEPLVLIPIMRDEAYIRKELEPKVLKFRDWLLDEYNKMVAKPIF